jgi:hypothetical protein
MGIEAKLKARIKREWPEILQTTTPEVQDFVIIDDILVRIRRYSQNQTPVTGEDVYQWMIEPVRREMRAGCRAYIITADDQEHVPPQKAATQVKRTTQKIALQGDFSISTGGLVVTDPVTNQITKQPFVLEHLINSRSMRIKLWQFLRRRLMDDVELEQQMRVYPDFQFVYEFKNGVVNLYPDDFHVWNDKNLRRNWPHGVIPQHLHGEADTSIAYWAYLYRDHPVIIRSVDGDQLSIQSFAMQQIPRDNAVWWQPFEQEYFNMNLFTQRLQETITVEGFFVILVICGNDFLLKRCLTEGYGVDRIWDAFVQAQAQGIFLPQPWDPTGNNNGLGHALMATLLILRCGASRPGLIGSLTSREVPQVFRILRTTTDELPDEDTLEKAFIRLYWNYSYWSTAIPAEHLTQGSTTSAKRALLAPKVAHSPSRAPQLAAKQVSPPASSAPKALGAAGLVDCGAGAIVSTPSWCVAAAPTIGSTRRPSVAAPRPRSSAAR